MMKSSIVIALAFAAGAATASPTKKPADVFGWQLDCATKKALAAHGPGMSDTSRVRKAVDSCLSGSISREAGFVRVSANSTLMALEERRETLIDAVVRRIQLCRDTGIETARFAQACPQLFTLERIALD